jgi:hypothetical protein
MSAILAKEIIDLRTEVAELKVMIQTLLDRKPEEKKTLPRKARKHRYPQLPKTTPVTKKKPQVDGALKFEVEDLWNDVASPIVPTMSAPPKHNPNAPIYTPA